MIMKLDKATQSELKPRIDKMWMSPKREQLKRLPKSMRCSYNAQIAIKTRRDPRNESLMNKLDLLYFFTRWTSWISLRLMSISNFFVSLGSAASSVSPSASKPSRERFAFMLVAVTTLVAAVLGVTARVPDRLGVAELDGELELPTWAMVLWLRRAMIIVDKIWTSRLITPHSNRFLYNNSCGPNLDSDKDPRILRELGKQSSYDCD